MLSTFYGDVLPAEGYFALWTKTDKHNIWYDSQDDLTAATQVRIKLKKQGVYYATAAFNETAANNGDKDARTQNNVVAKKCFYLDLDAGATKLDKHGPDKVYVTQKDALADAVRFCKETGLEPTYVISSGEGLHLYWVLDDAVDGATWTVVARKLSRLFKQHGLKEDSAVTADSARVLRPIGTLHENGAEVKFMTSKRGQTYNIGDLRDALANLLDDEKSQLPPPPKRERTRNLNKEFLVDGPPKSIRKIVVRCAAMAGVVHQHGNVEEPYWRAMLGIAKHTIEGDKAAHAFSRGHPDYDYHETQAKLDHWKTGPTSCAEFAKYCTDCKKCKHRSEIKSPITLGYLTDNETEKLPEELRPAPPVQAAPGAPWEDCLPTGFRVETQGKVNTLIYKMPVEREDPESGDRITVFLDVPFTTDIFWFGQWSDADHSTDTAQVSLHKWSDGRIKTFAFDQTLIANQQKLREFLASKSIIIGSHPKAAKATEEYSKMLLTAMKELKSMPKISRRFGVIISDVGEISCAHGEYVIHADGSVNKAILGDELKALAPLFALPLPQTGAVAWDASVWDSHILPRARRHVEFMKRHYRKPGLERYQLAAMMSIASPLMAFVSGEYLSGRDLPPGGLTVSLFSVEGGRGKTTLMRAAMLAYGRPQAMTSDRNTATATNNSRVARLSLMGTMPVGMDEMGETSAGVCASVVSAVANGNGRERAERTGGLIVGSPFALVNLMAANKSARDMIAASHAETNAIQFRLLELDVERVAEFSVEDRVAFTDEWSEIADCAGALGAVIEREICQFGVAAINKLVVGAVNKACQVVESKQTDRFQYRGMGAVIALHLILKRLGLDMFDLDTITNEFKYAHQSGHSYALENTLPSDGLALLNMALHDLMAHTAVTADETRRTRHVTKYDEPLVALPAIVHVRHIVNTNTSYVSANALRAWCIERKVSFTKVITAAKEHGVMTTVYASRGDGRAQAFNLLKGMRGSTESMVSCYAMNTKKLAIETGKNHVQDMLRDSDVADNVVPINAPAASEAEALETPATSATSQ